MTSVKATYNNETRRFRLEDVGKLKDVRDFLSKTFKTIPQPFDLKYKDDEGDLITITTDDELNEAARLYKVEMGNKVLRLIVAEAKAATPVAKPVAQPVLEIKEKKSAPQESKKEVVSINVESDKGVSMAIQLDAAGFNFKVLEAALRDKFGLVGAVEVKYYDDENDLVTMTDEKDLAEAQSLSKNVLKLRVGAPNASANASPAKKKPVGPSPVNKPWKEMSWEDIDKLCSELTKLGFKNHAKNTELIAKFEGNWAKIVETLEAGEFNSNSNSTIYTVD